MPPCSFSCGILAGNVRELHHVVKCAVLMNDSQDMIWLEHIPGYPSI